MIFDLKKIILINLTILVILFVPQISSSQEQSVNWVKGPTTATLGNNIADLDIGSDYIFLNGEDTRILMEELGNPPTNTEVGLIAPNQSENPWFIVFEYSPIGYIRDDEKDNLNPDKILEGLRNGNKNANKWRKERGFPLLFLNGWHKEPYYDISTNNLTWATLIGGNSASDSVNYNVKLLGRHGYMSATLVTTPNEISSITPELNEILNGFKFKQGKGYAEFVKGDAVAKYGLTALIAGGVGAAAVKFGLFAFLAKFWKIFAVAVGAFFVGIWNKVRNLGRPE
jgi:uncharacterized membrane-anchored protein